MQVSSTWIYSTYIICILPHLHVITVIDPIVSGCSLISKLASRAIQKCQCEEVRILTLCVGLFVRRQTPFVWGGRGEGYFFCIFCRNDPQNKRGWLATSKIVFPKAIFLMVFWSFWCSWFSCHGTNWQVFSDTNRAHWRTYRNDTNVVMFKVPNLNANSLFLLPFLVRRIPSQRQGPLTSIKDTDNHRLQRWFIDSITPDCVRLSEIPNGQQCIILDLLGGLGESLKIFFPNGSLYDDFPR